MSRHTRAQPCPVCGGGDYMPRGRGVRCSGWTNDGYAHCSRVEVPGAAQEGGGTWAHRLGPAGCRCGDVHPGLGPAPAASYPPRRPALHVTRWPIRNAAGAVVAVHVRRDRPDGKKESFTWERPDGTPGLGGLRTADLPLYRAPDLLAVDPPEVPVVVEGEKAADAIAAVGLVALGTVTGANSTPSDDVLRILAGRDVVLWPDDDTVGRAHMSRISTALARVGARCVRVVAWPATPGETGADAADVGDPAEIRSIVEGAREAGADPEPPSPAVTLSLADVQPVPIRWLWGGRIPLGKLTVIDGDPKGGKSLITLDLAARVSTGREMPDGTRGNLTGPASVVLLSAEDDPADTIRPRLDAAAGAPARVTMLRAVRRTVTGPDGETRTHEASVTLADIPAIERAVRDTAAALVVVDPVMAYIGGDADAHVDADIRGLLAPLAALAAETGAAFVMVRHLRKSGGANPLYAGGGSIGIIGAARSALMVLLDPDDETGQRRLLAHVGGNLSVSPSTLAYRIEATPHPVAGDVPCIAWDGMSALSASEAMERLARSAHDRDANETASRAPKRDEAAEWLRRELARGPRPVAEIRLAATESGLSWSTVQRARERIGVEIRREPGPDGLPGASVWALPPGEILAEALTGPDVSPAPSTRGSVKRDAGNGVLQPSGADSVRYFKLPEGEISDGTAPKPHQDANSGTRVSRITEPPGGETSWRGCAHGHPTAWRSVSGGVTCAECHPPATPEMVAEWIGGTP